MTQAHFYSKPTNGYWTCKAILDGRTISQISQDAGCGGGLRMTSLRIVRLQRRYGMTESKPASMRNYSLEGRVMFERYHLRAKGATWHVMARKSAGAATEAAWVSLGGCPSQLVAMRVYLGLVGRGGG